MNKEEKIKNMRNLIIGKEIVSIFSLIENDKTVGFAIGSSLSQEDIKEILTIALKQLEENKDPIIMKPANTPVSKLQTLKPNLN